MEFVQGEGRDLRESTDDTCARNKRGIIIHCVMSRVP
jgi:hypothetical protein